MANKSDNYLAHVEALKEFLPHAPELNEGSEWNSDFSFYKITESPLDDTLLLSYPNWTKIDIRRVQGITSFAPAGWLLIITDLPNAQPVALCEPRNNCIVLQPGERVDITNRDWIHATWIPCFNLIAGTTHVTPLQYTPLEKYLVVEHMPNKRYVCPTRQLIIRWTLTTPDTTVLLRLRNFYPSHLTFKADLTSILHPSHTLSCTFTHDIENVIALAAIPVAANNHQCVKGMLSPQETLMNIHTFSADPNGAGFRLSISPRNT
jgi:hypothetical protein